MQKHLLYINLFAISSALALAACSDEVENAVTPDMPEVGEKTPIVLSVGGVDAPEPLTRAVITDGTGKTMQNFDVNTKVFMIMKSEYSALSSPYEALNYGGSTDPKYTVTRGDVTKNTNAIVFNATNQRYWDDAHARSTKLNVWAYAQKGQSWTTCSFAVDKSGGGYDSHPYQTTDDIPWSTTAIYPMIFNWKASHLVGEDANKQNAQSVMCQDLLFSNNLVDNTSYSKPDGRLAFDPATRKFPQEGNAEMKFYHAMSKITIKIVEGDGFNTSSTSDFQFKSGTNVKLSGFNTEGLFSIQQGIFQQINAYNDIPSIYKWTTPASGDAYTLEALAVPNIDDFSMTYSTPQHDAYSRFVKDAKDYSTDVMMEFIIDNNKYQITSGQLYDALHVHDNGVPTATLVTNATEKTNNGNYIPLEAGKNYVFTFTIGKTKIKNITAQVVGWEDVVATPQTPSNARITLKVEERGDAQTTGVTLYRAKDAESPTSPTDTYKGYKWDAGYADMNATYSTSNSRWETNLFWDSNNDYYHFRALSPTGQTINTATSQPDNISLTSSSCANADSYNQLAWGAPFMDDDYNDVSETFKFTYDRTKGFDVNRTSGSESVKQIYHAIGATEDPIKIIMFHMMSGVHFTIKTTGSADSNTDKVELYRAASDPNPAKRTKVELVGYYSTGKVLLGTGFVDVTGTNTSATEINFASATDDGAYTDQEYFYSAVPQSLENVELVITTPDNNQYKVALKNVTATSVTSNNVSVTYTDNKLDYWYPGFKYNYTLTLKKTGITDLKATIVEWEQVTADDDVYIQ